MIAADDIYKYFFIVFQRKKDRQMIHMKDQALFPQKDKSEKIKCRLLLFLFGALRVKFLNFAFLALTDVAKYGWMLKDSIKLDVTLRKRNSRAKLTHGLC